MISFFKAKIKARAQYYLDGHCSDMKTLPPNVFWLVYFMTLSVLVQGVFDLLIKFIGYTPFFVQFPWRVDFLFLTAVSVLMGYQTLKGIQRRDLDVTRNSVQIGLLVELALVVGDIIFIFRYQEILPEAFWVRLPFIIFTSLNIFILIILSYRLHLFRGEDGKIQIF